MERSRQEGIRDWLDSPRLTIGALITFLLVITLLMLKLYVDQQKQVDRLDAFSKERKEQVVATNREAVQNCYSDAAEGPATRHVLEALLLLDLPPNAKRDIRDYSRLNALNAPTLRDCRRLAVKLRVPIPESVGG